MDHVSIILLGFIVLEKVVKLSLCEWDDIVIDGIKSIFMLKEK